MRGRFKRIQLFDQGNAASFGQGQIHHQNGGLELVHRAQSIVTVAHAGFDGKIRRSVERIGQAIEHDRVWVGQNQINAHVRVL